MLEPPKVVEQEVVKRERGITMVHPGALRTGHQDLPVLGAFGEFIETERRRSRNRMLLLAGFFIVILIAVVGAGLFISMVLFDRMDQDLRAAQKTFEDYKIEDTVRQSEAATTLTRIQGETKNLHENLSQQEDAMASTRESIDGFRTEYRQELVDLKKLVVVLEGENKTLRTELARTSAEIPELRDMMAALGRPAPLTVADPTLMTTPVMPGAGIVPAPRAAASLPDAASFELNLMAAGQPKSVAWRLPIPE